MRAQFDSRLARIESRRGRDRRCLFTDEESTAINEIFRKYLGRDPTREDVRGRDSVVYNMSDEEHAIIDHAVAAAARRGWFRKGGQSVRQ